MCGIVGYVGNRSATAVILNGLQKLEYRGYDSAGLAVVDRTGMLQTRRAAGKLDELLRRVEGEPVDGCIGMGHTRWATHGAPSESNAHPHRSPDGVLAVVQNGIVENYLDLKAKLGAIGYSFASDTDTEVIAHLIHYHYVNGCGRDLAAAVREAMCEMKGPNAIVAISQENPDRLVAARQGYAGGIAIGYGNDEMYVASDVPALQDHTRGVAFLESGQIATVTRNQACITWQDGNPAHVNPMTGDWSLEQVQRGRFRHFMEKEIYEQPESLTATLRGRIDAERNRIVLEPLRISKDDAAQLPRITIVACGTSYYAGLVGKHYIERLAGVPVEVEYASEYRTRGPIVTPGQLVLAITQSGETADTLAALDLARSRGAQTAAIVNAEGSQAARLCDGVLTMNAGPEIGVASTKAFTVALLDLLLLATYLGEARNVLSEENTGEMIRAILGLPGLAGRLLAQSVESQEYEQLAERFHTRNSFLYLGRGLNYPIAREGALKLKEISYIHAEGYPAGEMKHGPIALVSRGYPVVVIAPQDNVYKKTLSQIEQVKARDGVVLAVGNEHDDELARIADHVLRIPAAHELLNPILGVIPLQVFAYHMALRSGADVDRPRNLAKSVTVE